MLPAFRFLYSFFFPSCVPYAVHSLRTSSVVITPPELDQRWPTPTPVLLTTPSPRQHLLNKTGPPPRLPWVRASLVCLNGRQGPRCTFPPRFPPPIDSVRNPPPFSRTISLDSLVPLVEITKHFRETPLSSSAPLSDNHQPSPSGQLLT